MKKSIKMQSHTGLHGSRAILSGSRLLWPGNGRTSTVSVWGGGWTSTGMRNPTLLDEFLKRYLKIIPGPEPLKRVCAKWMSVTAAAREKGGLS